MPRKQSHAIRQLQPLMQFPSMPATLLRDEIPLPLNYQVPTWADRVQQEWKHYEQLEAAGAWPTQSICIYGPSGVGKSVAARWIAHSLGLPMVTMLLSTAIESFMGATGTNINNAVKFATDTPVVLLMDEIDAVASSRGSRQDHGEAWRITNTIIQVLDHWHGSPRKSLLVATTNVIDSVDEAIRQRFELQVEVPMPTTRELSTLAAVALPADYRGSYRELNSLILRAKRESIVRGGDYASTLLHLIASQ